MTSARPEPEAPSDPAGEGPRRVFLGWNAPALPAAVDWFAEHFGRPRGWDLTGLTVALPAARATRRLLELLTARAEPDGALIPPRICTLGDLPEHLCPPPTELAVADDTRAMLTRVRVLRHIGSDRLAQLVPNPPESDDLMGWWRLADRLRQLDDDLAGGMLTVAEVLERHRAGEVSLGGAGGEHRWEGLAAIDAAYHELLAHDGLIDRQRHRLACVHAGACACEDRLILIGAADQSPLLQAMLAQVAPRVTALIHAPESHAAGFDPLGALLPEYWHDQDVPFDDEALRIVERTTDQPGEVAAAIAQFNEQRRAAERPALAADQISVALGDERQGGAVRRALQRAAAPAHVAAGRELAWTPPAMLLDALADFAERRRLDAFAALLRHPDVAAYLRRHLPDRDAAADWLTLLDDYITHSLRAEVADDAFGNRERWALARAYRAVTDLLPDDPSARRPLPELTEAVSRTLGAFYADRHFTRHHREDDAAIAALEAIGDVLRAHAQLDASHDATPHVTLAEAMRLVLAQARGRSVPERGGEAAVELLGFLELPLDDAPAVIVTSLNEHQLPATPRGDIFLPDAVRRTLGLRDAAHRYARDKQLLRAALGGREHVMLIAPRRAAEGDPLSPSRLLLACDEATRTARVRRFYDDERADAAPRRALLAPGERNRFLIPHPLRVGGAGGEPGAPVPGALSVTAFRDYLECPYRFYLKHVRKLKPCDDRATELDPLAFGNVAHEVLEAFAHEGPTRSEDVAEIEAFLEEALDASFRRHFGTRVRPALRIQHRQLQERLGAFAAQQAGRARAGWRIAHAEQKLEATLRVDAHTVTIKGKIDRIDVHEDLGHCVIDYKTGDTPRNPKQTHRGRVRGTHRPVEEQGAEGWVDLQLPLYLDLVEQTHGLDRERTALAQFNLPRKLEEVKLHVADWDAEQLAEAQRVRDWVIAQICDGRFWPPQEPTGRADELTWLCADQVLDRRQLIYQSERDVAALTREGGDDE